MKKDYGSSAKQLVQAMGGKDNITRVFHCMTRLRFYVKDRSKIDEAAIKKLSEISGVNWHQDQFQVIAGNEVNEMYAELVKMGIPNDDTDSSVQASAEKKSVASAIVDSITGCMTPMIPALTAAGMIKVVMTLLTTFNLVTDTSSTYQVINFIGDAAFYFMPFLKLYNMTKNYNIVRVVNHIFCDNHLSYFLIFIKKLFHIFSPWMTSRRTIFWRFCYFSIFFIFDNYRSFR